MPLEITLDDSTLRAFTRAFPGREAKALRRGLAKFGSKTVRAFTNANMSSPDDRVPVPALGGLGIRPNSSTGLTRRSGSLARSFIFRTEGNTVDALLLRLGFLNPLMARIARVQEKGMRIIGRPFLAIPIRGAGAIGKKLGMVLLRAVTIPPRLGFAKFMPPFIRTELAKTVEAELTLELAR